MKLTIRTWEKANNWWREHEFEVCQIFTGFYDKHDRPIYTGDIIEYTDTECGEDYVYQAEIKFSIQAGAWLHWKTWKPFRKDLSYWLLNKDKVEIMMVEKNETEHSL